VATVFIPRVINHIDCDKLNNSAENLEWTTHSYNSRHAYENGRQPAAFGIGQTVGNLIVVNLQTGIFYESIKEAHHFESVRFTYDWMLRKFKGKTTKHYSHLIVAE
jgi:hypothetical protein